MSGFELNKIAAAVLVAMIILIATRFIAEALYHPMMPEKRGYQVAGAEEAAPTATAAVPKELPPIAQLLASANTEAGQAAAKKCAACHTFEKGGANKVGPNLWNVVGSNPAHTAGFNYSDAMKASEGAWDYDKLYKFLHNPKNVVKGTKMAFAGISKPEEIADIIAYLRSLSDNPKPLPK